MTAQNTRPASPCSSAWTARRLSAATSSVNPPAYARNAAPDHGTRMTGTPERVNRRPDGPLPAARLEQLFGCQSGGGEASHRFPETGRHPRDDLRVVEVRRRFDDRLRPGHRILGL